jgi:hypothetical protein
MALQAINCHNYTILLFKAGQTDGITAPCNKWWFEIPHNANESHHQSILVLLK